MAAQRRPGERRPGGRSGVSRRRRGARQAGDAGPVRSLPRVTTRAAVLLLVLAALVASYASSLRAYLDQRAQIAAVEQSIAASERGIAELEREKQRWADPAYVVAQARARFAFGFPGEVGYQVLDEDGRPLDHEDSLSPPPEAPDRPEWWETTVRSVVVAGHPSAARSENRLPGPRELRPAE